MATLLHAYLTSGANTIGLVRPSALGESTLAVLGHDVGEVFRLSIPCGMSRYTTLDAMIAVDDLPALDAADPWTLTLDDGVPGAPLTVQGLTHVESCPVFVGERMSALVKVRLVDERYWWGYTSASHDPAYRYSTQQPCPVLTTSGGWYTDALAATPAAAIGFVNARAIQYGLAPVPLIVAPASGYDVRWAADIAANPAASLGLLVDCIGRATGNVIVWDASTQAYAWRLVADLNTDYCTAISGDLDLMRGGRDAVNSPVSPADPILDRVATMGARLRVPQRATVTAPIHATEGLTIHPVAAVPMAGDPIELSYPTRVVSALQSPGIVEIAVDPPLAVPSVQARGSVMLHSSRAASADDTGVLPAATVTELSDMGADSWVRIASLPVGRTIRGGWIREPHLAGQVSEVAYMIGSISTGEIPYTVTSLGMDDWIVSASGRGVTHPSGLVSVRGAGVAVRSMVGSTVIDIPAQPARPFAAKITGSAAAPNGNAWQWVYTWEEVEPDGTICSATLAAAQRRTSDQVALRAVNLPECANDPTGGTGGAGFIAPGVDVGTYSGVTMEPLPIAVGTEVLMHESQQVWVAAASVVRYWFALPNAIQTTCD